MELTLAQVQAIGDSRSKLAIMTALVDEINQEGDQYYLDTPLRVAHFLGHIFVESAGFSRLVENLNYSAAAMMKAWPSRFPTVASTAPYAQNPRALANYTYGGRYGNRAHTDDGYNFRGRGVKQTTFHDNYAAFTSWIRKRYPNAPDFVANPDQLALMPWAVLSGVWYWVTRNMWQYADADDIEGGTKVLNGGTNGLKDRTLAINKAKKILIASEPIAATMAPAKVADQELLGYQAKLNQIATEKNLPALNVGTVDGWMGPQTERAVRAFQKFASLKQDGILGPETKEAIDNAVGIINLTKSSSIAEDLHPSKDVVVDQVPVNVPDHLLSTIDKPVLQNKSLWAYASGAGGLVLSYKDTTVAWFEAQSQVIQIAILFLFAVAMVLAYLSIRDFLRARKGVKELKQNVQAASDHVPPPENDEPLIT